MEGKSALSDQHSAVSKEPSAIRKFIFFPNNYEARKKPYVIYVGRYSGDDLIGSNLLKEVQEGRFGFYPRKRCQPYSEALMQAVNEWVARREQLEKDYERLRKKGVTDDYKNSRN